jgi:hypothetical protein
MSDFTQPGLPLIDDPEKDLISGEGGLQGPGFIARQNLAIKAASSLSVLVRISSL